RMKCSSSSPSAMLIEGVMRIIADLPRGRFDLAAALSCVTRGQKRVADARGRAYDPRVHLLSKKFFAKEDGLPGQKRVYARRWRAMPGNDELTLRGPPIRRRFARFGEVAGRSSGSAFGRGDALGAADDGDEETAVEQTFGHALGVRERYRI